MFCIAYRLDMHYTCVKAGGKMASSGKTACTVALGLKLLAFAAQAQPVVNEIANAASYLYPPLPSSSIAQGSFFVVLGSPTPGLERTGRVGHVSTPDRARGDIRRDHGRRAHHERVYVLCRPILELFRDAD